MQRSRSSAISGETGTGFSYVRLGSTKRVLPGPYRKVRSCSGHSPPLSQTGQSSGWLISRNVGRDELQPGAGAARRALSALNLGPAWWFHDSPEGMLRFREQTTETAGFYNTVGFNDDTRAFLSIPARHDVARRVDCVFLARLVAEHRLDEDPQQRSRGRVNCAYRLPKPAYRL